MLVRRTWTLHEPGATIAELERCAAVAPGLALRAAPRRRRQGLVRGARLEGRRARCALRDEGSSAPDRRARPSPRRRSPARPGAALLHSDRTTGRGKDALGGEHDPCASVGPRTTSAAPLKCSSRPALSALDCLLEKLCSLRRADDAVWVLKCDVDAKRPTAPGQSCWVTLRRERRRDGEALHHRATRGGGDRRRLRGRRDAGRAARPRRQGVSRRPEQLLPAPSRVRHLRW